MTEILHVTLRESWEKALLEGEYRGDQLEAEGFIHCCLSGQFSGVVSRYFKGQTGLVLLRIDPSRLMSLLKFESPPGSEEMFPHVYGPINLDAVDAVLPLEAFLAGEKD